MTNTLVKICGITNIEDALVSSSAGADFLGLIFATSPRKVNTTQAKSIITELRSHFNNKESSSSSTFESKKILSKMKEMNSSSLSSSEWYSTWNQEIINLKKIENNRPLFVGVFSNSTVEEMNEIVELVGLDFVQLHGDEHPLIAKDIHVPCIKAFHVMAGESSQDLVARLEKGCGSLAGILLDTGIKGLQQQGGSGIQFDWNIANEIQENYKIPVWMAGGLTHENVNEAAIKIKPFVVDVSSGVEQSKGLKDHDKVIRFITNSKTLN